MTKLILHIGTKKTGTSTLQSFLLENEQKLNQYGFSFYCNPKKSYFYGNGRSWGGHFPLVAGNSETWPSEYLSREKYAQSKTALRDLVADIRTTGKHAILSAEHFSATWTTREPIDRLKEAFQDFDTTILVYVRPQEELLTSAYGTSILAGNTHRFGLKSSMQSDVVFNYAMMADLWASVFGKQAIRVRNYKALDGDDIRRDVLTTMGITDHRAFAFGDNINASPGARYTNALRVMNQFLPRSWELPSDRDRHFMAVVRHEVSRLALPDDVPLSALLSPRQVAKIRTLFRESNRLLQETYMTQSLDNWDRPIPASTDDGTTVQATKTDLAYLAVELAKAMTLLKLQNASRQKTDGTAPERASS